MKRRKGENRVRPRSNPQRTRHCQPEEGKFRIAVTTCQRRAEGPVQKCSTPSAFGPIGLTCSATAEQSSCRETKSRPYRSVLLDGAGPLVPTHEVYSRRCSSASRHGSKYASFLFPRTSRPRSRRGASQADLDGHLFRHSRWSGPGDTSVTGIVMHAIERACKLPGARQGSVRCPISFLPPHTKDQTSKGMLCGREVSSWAEGSFFCSMIHWICPFQHWGPIMSYCVGTTLGAP